MNDNHGSKRKISSLEELHKERERIRKTVFPKIFVAVALIGFLGLNYELFLSKAPDFTFIYVWSSIMDGGVFGYLILKFLIKILH